MQTTAAKAQLAATKAQTLLDRAGSILDIQQAEIYAALQGKITDNEKLRLDLQLALLTKNAAAADILSQELLISQLQTTDLAKTISSLPKALNPFADWPQYIQDLIAQMAKLAAAIPVLPTCNQSAPFNSSPSATTGTPPLADLSIGNMSDFFGPNTSPNYNLNPTTPLYQYNSLAQSAPTPQINLTLNVDGSEFARAVQNAQIDINKNGYSTSPAGQGF